MNLHATSAPVRGESTFIARCIRGIEWILAAEIETRIRPEAITLAHRTVRFTICRLPALDDLRFITADDVFLQVGVIDGVDRTRASLARLRELANGLAWDDALLRLGHLQGSAPWMGYSITASALGRRNYNRYEIEDAVAEGAAIALSRLPRTSGGPQQGIPELALRIHLDGAQAVVAARIFETPLHRRNYKVRSCAGTLHPPLAAAMAMIAGLEPGSQVIDPFTGVGTIPIEAKRLQPEATVIGVDIDAARVAGAAENARRAGVRPDFVRADAGRLPCDRGGFTHVISNPPWHRAVAMTGRLAHAPRERERGLARLLQPGGRAVLLLDPHDPLAEGGALGFCLLHRSWLSVFGQYPRLCVLSSGEKVGGAPREAVWSSSLERWYWAADTVEVRC